MCNDLDAAISNFKELVNRSIIQRTDASSKNNEDRVKTYHTHGMMLEFIVNLAILLVATCGSLVPSPG